MRMWVPLKIWSKVFFFNISSQKDLLQIDIDFKKAYISRADLPILFSSIVSLCTVHMLTDFLLLMVSFFHCPLSMASELKILSTTKVFRRFRLFFEQFEPDVILLESGRVRYESE